MLKETETEETIVFFVTFLSLVAFQLGGGRPPGPPGYAYDYLYAGSKIFGTVSQFWNSFSYKSEGLGIFAHPQ